MKKVIRNIIYVILATLMIIAFIYLGTKDYNENGSKLKDNEIMAKNYSLINNDNLYKILSPSEAAKFTGEGTGIILFCFKSNNWCNAYVKMVNDIASENEIEEIYYFDILDDRKENSYYYQKIITNTKEHLWKDDTDDYKLFVPSLFVIKNGVILGNIDETNKTISTDDYKTYWTEEKILEFKIQLNTLIEKIIEKKDE